MGIMEILIFKEPELNSKLDLGRDGKYPPWNNFVTAQKHRSPAQDGGESCLEFISLSYESPCLI